MSAKLTENCTNEAQLEKIRKGQERKFRWRDDWPEMEKAILIAGNATIQSYEEKHKPDQAS